MYVVINGTHGQKNKEKKTSASVPGYMNITTKKKTLSALTMGVYSVNQIL